MFEVAVIGCGVVGLTSALSIQECLGNKVKVTIYTKDVSPHTTGDIAAGLWSPYLLKDTPIEKILQWSKETQDFILKRWKEGKAKEMGISLQPITNLYAGEYELPEWMDLTLGYQELSKDQLNKFSKQFGKEFSGGVSFVSFIWEASKFLPYLLNIFIEKGGQIKKREISEFKELKNYDLVVNCAGLNAKYLTGDQLLNPIRGQIMCVDYPTQFHTVIVDDKDATYIIPNMDFVVLGGTKQLGNYNLTVDEEDRKHIINGCAKFVPSLFHAEVIQNKVGLRPSRDSVRVELDEVTCRAYSLPIVHNYGHGGSGITLCIGCAKETATIVKYFYEQRFTSRSKL